MAKATDAEVELRIEAIVVKLLEGDTRYKILQYCTTFDIRERQADEYITRAWERIQEVNTASRPQHVSRHLKRLDTVAYKASLEGDWSSVLKAYDLQAKVLGIELAPAEQTPRLPHLSDENLRSDLMQEAIH